MNDKEKLLISRLKKYGMNEKLLDKLTKSENIDLVKKVIKLTKYYKTSQKRAKEIMGKNFFGIADAKKFYHIKPTKRQLEMLSSVPFSESVLKRYKNTHVLVAVFPLSINKIRDRVDPSLFFRDYLLCAHEKFFKKADRTSWQLIAKDVVKNSTMKVYGEQVAMLGKNERVPTAQAMVYTIIGYYLKNNQRLFKDVCARTSSISSIGRNVFVGKFMAKGLYVFDFWSTNDCGYFLGVTRAQKSKLRVIKV